MVILSSYLSKASSLRLLVILYGIFACKLAVFMFFRHAPTEELRGQKNLAHNALPNYFPVEPLQPVRTFIENSVHFRVTGDDNEWESLVPGNGLVYLGDGDEKQPYTMSMLHQLKCIDIVRREIADLDANPHGLTSRPSELSHHCVQYLRQMVLCRGDLDFDIVFGKPRPNVFPDVYQCSDWEAVYQAVEENQRLAGVL